MKLLVCFATNTKQREHSSCSLVAVSIALFAAPANQIEESTVGARLLWRQQNCPPLLLLLFSCYLLPWFCLQLACNGTAQAEGESSVTS